VFTWICQIQERNKYLMNFLGCLDVGSGKPWMLVYLSLKYITWTPKRATQKCSAKLPACYRPRCLGTAPTFTKYVT
jgi:hypothetical protein